MTKLLTITLLALGSVDDPSRFHGLGVLSAQVGPKIIQCVGGVRSEDLSAPEFANRFHLVFAFRGCEVPELPATSFDVTVANQSEGWMLVVAGPFRAEVYPLDATVRGWFSARAGAFETRRQQVTFAGGELLVEEPKEPLSSPLVSRR